MPLCFEPPAIYFMHLPHTGSAALGRWLRTLYGRRGYVNLMTATLPGMAAARLQRFACYHSWHLGRGMFDGLARPELACVTLLRQPVERALSDICEIQRTARDHGHRFTAHWLALLQPWLHATAGDCVRSGVMDPLLANTQSRILGNQHDYTRLLHAPRSGLRAPLNAVSWLDFPWLTGGSTAADAASQARAGAWLKQMAVVGLTERYAESLLLIADLLGVPAPAHLSRVEVAPQCRDHTLRCQDRLAPDVVARLEALNRDDLELYARAAALFEEQWARYQARPRRTCSIAPRLRQVFHPLAALSRRVAKPLPRAPALCQYMGRFGRRQGLRIYGATLFGTAGEVQIQTRRAIAPIHLRPRTSDLRIYGQVMVREEYALMPGPILAWRHSISPIAILRRASWPSSRKPPTSACCARTLPPIRRLSRSGPRSWDAPATVTLVGQPGQYSAVRIPMTEQPAPGTAMGQAATVTMPQLMTEYQVDYVDLLKMDIEGAEQEVFAAAAPWIGQVGVIIAELHGRFRPGCALSFYAATRGFSHIWRRGEHIIAARRDLIQPEQGAER